MTTIGIVSLCGIIAAFVVFAVVLAWGDYQTRGITHPQPDAKPSEGFKMLKGAAEFSSAKAQSAPATIK